MTLHLATNASLRWEKPRVIDRNAVGYQPIVATAARMIGSSNPLRGEEGGQGEGEGRQARFAALVLKP